MKVDETENLPVKYQLDLSSRSEAITACDRQTDRQTDTDTDTLYRASIASREKHNHFCVRQSRNIFGEAALRPIACMLHPGATACPLCPP